MPRMFKKLLVAGAIEAILLTAAALLRPQFLVEHWMTTTTELPGELF
jgi:hypothetical protein